MNGGEHADVWQWHMTPPKTCWKILKKAPFKAIQMFSFNVITLLASHMCYWNLWEFHKSACTALYMMVNQAELPTSKAYWSAFRLQILDDEHENPINPGQALVGASHKGNLCLRG